MASLLVAYSVFFYVPLAPKVEIKTANSSGVPTGSLVLEWGDTGKKMVEYGVIDGKKLEDIHVSRGEFGDTERKMLYEDSDLIITESNGGFVLNLLWAFGLANKNEILEKGPMATSKTETANFASTGGWSLVQGDVMDHYSMHKLVELAPEQQRIVLSVASNIYRPCCGNPTHFPDCNHGMAMLGLLELMASQNKTEKEMYAAALFMNQLWFGNEYANINKLFEKEGLEKDPKMMLSADYSSSRGYRDVLSKVEPTPSGQNGGGCGV